jgi:hypothetical protein
VLDLSGTAAGLQHADQVDADVGRMHALLVHPSRRETSQPGGLARSDALQRRTEPGARPGLDLADHQHVAVTGDDVDLTDVAAPVAVENGQPGAAQVCDGNVLAVLPQAVLGEQPHHLRRQRFRPHAVRRALPVSPVDKARRKRRCG